MASAAARRMAVRVGTDSRFFLTPKQQQPNVRGFVTSISSSATTTLSNGGFPSIGAVGSLKFGNSSGSLSSSSSTSQYYNKFDCRQISQLANKQPTPQRGGFIIDTLDFVRRLEAQGVQTAQAEAVTGAVVQLLNNNLSLEIAPLLSKVEAIPKVEMVDEADFSKSKSELVKMLQEANLFKYKSEVQRNLLELEIERLKLLPGITRKTFADRLKNFLASVFYGSFGGIGLMYLWYGLTDPDKVFEPST